MIGRTSTLSRSLASGLALVLAAHAVISYPLPLVGEIAASTILLTLVVAVGRWLFSQHLGPRLSPSARALRPSSLAPCPSPLVPRPSPPRPLPLAPRPSPLTPSSLALFLLVFSGVVTVQVLVAQEVYGPLRIIDSTPGYAVFARLLHYLVVVAVVLAGRERSRAVGLGVAMVYTSVFYCPTFTTPEAAPPFIPLAALALVLLAKGIADYELRFTFYVLRFFSPCLPWSFPSFRTPNTRVSPGRSNC